MQCSVALLNSRLRLHDIDDTEAFAVRLVRRYATDLGQDDFEELIVYLVEVAWELSLRYQPGKSANGFSAGAGTILARRIIDWRRSKFGRTRWVFAGRIHERAQPSIVSLDELDDAGRDRLGSTLATGSGDSTPDWDAISGGLFGDRDRTRAEDLATLGQGPDH
jgi:hypothetical protein